MFCYLSTIVKATSIIQPLAAKLAQHPTLRFISVLCVPHHSVQLWHQSEGTAGCQDSIRLDHLKDSSTYWGPVLSSWLVPYHVTGTMSHVSDTVHRKNPLLSTLRTLHHMMLFNWHMAFNWQCSLMYTWISLQEFLKQQKKKKKRHCSVCAWDTKFLFLKKKQNKTKQKEKLNKNVQHPSKQLLISVCHLHQLHQLARYTTPEHCMHFQSAVAMNVMKWSLKRTENLLVSHTL